MADIVLFLRDQADDIDDTARRCNDPAIVSELQYISEQLRAEALRLESA
jgi:hypothetical protein